MQGRLRARAESVRRPALAVSLVLFLGSFAFGIEAGAFLGGFVAAVVQAFCFELARGPVRTHTGRGRTLLTHGLLLSFVPGLMLTSFVSWDGLPRALATAGDIVGDLLGAAIPVATALGIAWSTPSVMAYRSTPKAERLARRAGWVGPVAIFVFVGVLTVSEVLNRAGVDGRGAVPGLSVFMFASLGVGVMGCLADVAWSALRTVKPNRPPAESAAASGPSLRPTFERAPAH